MQVKRFFTKYLLGILFFMSFQSCKEERKIVYYKFNNVTVTRCDIDKKSYFYYGNSKDGNKIVNEACVIVDWQFDDFFNSALIFQENGTVEILKKSVGEFTAFPGRGKIFFKDYTSPQYDAIMQKYYPPNRFHNFCYLGDSLVAEATKNKENGSDVIMEYEKSTN